jgi:hypothetical protein
VPPAVVPFFNVVSGFWPIIIAAAVLILVVCVAGGLVGIVAHGAAHVLSFAINSGARVMAVAGLVALALIMHVVLTSIGAPDASTYIPAAPNVPAAVQGAAAGR